MAAAGAPAPGGYPPLVPGSAGGVPRVTIGVFCYNQEPLVRGAINSALAQQPAPVDLVVADDGSSDGSVDVIREVLAAAATPTTLIADGVNRGLATRLNQALDAASGDWVVWLAADDLLLPTALADLTAAASDDVDVVFGDLDVMDELGRPRGYSRPRDTWQRATAERYRDGRPPLPDMFEVNNFVPGGMCLIRRRALRDACGYDPAIRTEDLDMWLRIGWASRFRYVGRSVGRYRVVPGSTSRSERQNTLDQARIARKHRDDLRMRRGCVRLVSMRWALAVGRGRGRPGVSLGEVADTAGVARTELLRALPAAATRPVAGSALAAGRARLLPGVRR